MREVGDSRPKNNGNGKQLKPKSRPKPKPKRQNYTIRTDPRQLRFLWVEPRK